MGNVVASLGDVPGCAEKVFRFIARAFARPGKVNHRIDGYMGDMNTPGAGITGDALQWDPLSGLGGSKPREIRFAATG